jgi:hypothetical protein
MKQIHVDDLRNETKSTACSTEGKDCGCSNGMCPGTILAGVILAGWGLWALGSWLWGIVAG